jgi:hypothetical protein
VLGETLTERSPRLIDTSAVRSSVMHAARNVCTRSTTASSDPVMRRSMTKPTARAMRMTSTEETTTMSFARANCVALAFVIAFVVDWMWSPKVPTSASTFSKLASNDTIACASTTGSPLAASCTARAFATYSATSGMTALASFATEGDSVDLATSVTWLVNSVACSVRSLTASARRLSLAVCAASSAE